MDRIFLKGFVTDISQNSNKLRKTEEITFVRGEDEKSASELTAIASELDNVVTLTFDGKVNGETAVNKANYSVEGATVKSVVLTSNTDAKAVVTVTFEEGTITNSGTYALAVDGVKAADGTLVEADSFELELTENVAPTLDTATLVNVKDIELTFSEAVKNVDITDFKLLLDGEAVEGATVAGDNAEGFVLSFKEELTVKN